MSGTWRDLWLLGDCSTNSPCLPGLSDRLMRMTERIGHADQQAARWDHAAAVLDRQAREHRTEADGQQSIVAVAEAAAARARVELVAPLIEQAAADGRAYLTARGRVWEASGTLRTARRLGKRSATRALTAADEERRRTEAATRRRWGSTPQTPEGIEPWAIAVAQQAVDPDPRVTETQERADDTRRAQQRLADQHIRERSNLRDRLLGNRPAGGSPKAHALRWRDQAETSRRDLATIEALPVSEAARIVRTRAEQEQAQREAAEQVLKDRQARAAQLHDFTHRPLGHGPTRPDRRLGL